VQRLVLTWALPFPTLDADSFGQNVLGAAFTLTFSTLYTCMKPLTSRTTSLLAIVVNFVIILNYTSMMVLFVDQNLSDDDDRSGLRGKYVAGFLIGTNAGLAPACAFYTLFVETNTTRNFVRRAGSRCKEVVRRACLGILAKVRRVNRERSSAKETQLTTQLSACV